MYQIAIFIDSLAGGGAEKVAMTLARAMQVLGHQITMFVLNRSGQYDAPESLPIVYLNQNSQQKSKGWFNRKSGAYKLQALVEEEQSLNGMFDLFLVNLEESYRIVSACNFTPCFYIIHNSLEETLARTKKLGPAKYFYLKNILRKLNNKQLIAVSHGVARELADSTLFNAASIKTIYNPFDINKIQNLSEQYNKDIPKGRYIIHVGRFAKQKRHDILFSAMAKIPVEYKLVCLCKHSNKLTRMIDKFGMQSRVVVTGFVQNPYNWIKQAELLVLSSDFEGLPTVLIEALICGTPVVSTDCPHGPSEIMTGELSNYLVPSNDPEKLVGKINQALREAIDIQNAEVLHKIPAESIAKQYLSLI